MPAPTITPRANLSQLRAYVRDVESRDGKGRKTLFNKAGGLDNKAQSSLLKSVINSAGGKKKEGLALNMFFEALVHSYGEDVAAHVFWEMREPLFNGIATLSTTLIDDARGHAEAKKSELADLSKNAVNKIDIHDDNQSRVENEEDIVVINMNKKKDDANRASPGKYKKITFIDSKNKNAVTGPKKNAASGRIRSSKLNENRQKLEDTKNKTKEVKEVYTRLTDIKETGVRKQKQKRRKLFRKRLNYQKRKEKLTRRKAGGSSRAQHNQYVKTNQKMQADLYLKAMDKGGKDRNGNDIMSFDSLAKEAALGLQKQPWMSSKDNFDAREAICTAFQNYDPGHISAMDHKTKTEKIAKPALTAFLKDLNNKK